MQYSHKQIVLKFKECFEAHHFVQRYTYGDYETSQINKKYPFPHVHLEPVSVTFGDTIGYTFDLTIRDLERVEEFKQQHIEQILSDTLQTVQDFQAYIAKGDEFFDRNLIEFTSTAASARWDSETQNVAGWQMTFTINVPNDHDICSIPLGDATPEPPADCNPAILVDSDGNTLREIPSGATFTLLGYRISSSSGTYSGDITAISAIGSVAGSTLQDVVALFNGNVNPDNIAQDIVNGADAELQSEIADLVCPATSVIPDYRRPAKPDSSYYTGDLGDQYDNGDFDRLDSDRTGRVRVLGADSYTLDANTLNSFGTTARYTFTNGDNAWNGTSFDTTYPVDAEDYVIICHLTGLAIYVANLGSSLNWDSARDAAAALSVGDFDWRLVAPDELDAIIPDRGSAYYSAGNMFRRGVVSGFTETFQWTSRIDEVVSTNNAFRYSGELESARRNKTTTSLMSCYAVANYTE